MAMCVGWKNGLFFLRRFTRLGSLMFFFAKICLQRMQHIVLKVETDKK